MTRVTDSPPGTLRRPVVAVAMEMFNKRPYDEISVEDIAASAGVPGRDCYRHFGSKLGIFLAALRQAVDDAVAAVSRDGPEDDRGRLRFGLRAYLDHMTANPRGHLYLSGEVVGGGIEEQFREALRRTVTRALLRCVSGDRPGTLPELVPGWVALAESMVCDWARHGVPGRDDIETVLCDLFFAVVETADGHSG